MGSASEDFHLRIARGTSKIVVALCAVKVSGRARRHEWGSITDFSPGEPLKKADVDRQRSRAMAFVGVCAFALCIMGLWWWLVSAGALILLLVIAFSKAHEPGSVIALHIHRYPDIHRVLTTFEERTAFLNLIRLAERVGKTLPALKDLVEPSEAGELLAKALWDGAKSLARRQEIRAVLDDLKRHERDALPPLSRSRHDLENQRQRAKALWDEVNAELDRLTEHLTAAAVSGETFLRDRELDRTLRRTERALAELMSDDKAGGSTASEQLADETTAVLDAYRELTELYGGKA